MKKLVSILLVLMMVAGMTSALAADSSVSGGDYVADSAPATADGQTLTTTIAPTVTINSTGFVNLAITYPETPAITMNVDKSGNMFVTSPTVKTDRQVTFTLTNSSIAGEGSGSSFTGALKVNADASLTSSVFSAAFEAASVNLTAPAAGETTTGTALLTYDLKAGDHSYETNKDSFATLLSTSVTFTIDMQ